MEWIRRTDYRNPNDYKEEWERVPVGTIILIANPDMIIGDTIVPDIDMVIKSSINAAQEIYPEDEENCETYYIPEAFLILDNPLKKKTVC